MGSITEVSPVSGGILSDQDEFLNSLIRKSLSLIKDRSKFSTSVTTSDLWNGAKGAGIRTTLCNFQVGNERRGREDSRRLFIIEKSRFGEVTLSLWFLFQKFRKVLKVSRSNKEVYLR
jgi:hypothetical protein